MRRFSHNKASPDRSIRWLKLFGRPRPRTTCAALELTKKIAKPSEGQLGLNVVGLVGGYVFKCCELILMEIAIVGCYGLAIAYDLN